MRLALSSLLVLLALGAVPARRAAATEPAAIELRCDRNGPFISGIPVQLELLALDASGEADRGFHGEVELEGVLRDGRPLRSASGFRDGVLTLEGVTVPSGRAVAEGAGTRAVLERHVLPGWTTLLPPLVAIGLALITRQVLASLFAGVWTGAFLLEGYRPLRALLRSADTFLVGAVADEGHASILLFSLTLAGLVGVITATGGVRGVVEAVSRLASGPRSGQVATWLMGLFIFFDDYANSLIVGNTMRPFTDRLRISREKLAFIVDATAAPVATVGIISTWTAYQLGLVGDVLAQTPEAAGGAGEPYWFFLRSIPASFYSLLMILLVFLVGATLRDFGPLRRAEERCRRTGAVHRADARPLVDPSLDRMGQEDDVIPRWLNAVVPIACVVLFTLAGLWFTGRQEAGPGAPLREIVGHADAYRALLWASLGASLVAMGIALLQGFRLERVLDNWVSGARALVLAAMILVLAWSIGEVCERLDTGGWVLETVRDVLSPRILPAGAFLAAGVIAFSTGTSYGTMAILVPILLPLAFRLTAGDALAPGTADSLRTGTLAAILGGSVFGDHCSPISDTTVLSSMAAGSDHVDHVRTQLPYAVLGALSALGAYLLLGAGVPALAALAAAALVLTGTFFLIGRRPGTGTGPDPPNTRSAPPGGSPPGNGA